MKLLELLEVEAAGQKLKVLLVSAAGGLLSATIVVVVNEAAAGSASPAWHLGALFLLVLGTMFVCNRMAARWVVGLYEGVLRTLIARFTDALHAAPLQALEASQDRHAKALGELLVVSTSITALVASVQSAAFLLCVGMMIAQISLKALAIWLVVLGLLIRRVQTGTRALRREMERLSAIRGVMTERLEELVYGFKQLKLDETAQAEVHRELNAAVDELTEQQREATDVGRELLLGAVLVYCVFAQGVVVMGPESTVGLGPILGYEVAIILALCWSPLLVLMSALPTLSRAEAAACSVLEANAQLGTHAPDTDKDLDGVGFETIALEELVFDHATSQGGRAFEFRVGPIDLALRRGELMMITGSSGSGKTTLIKLLLGLYLPVGGRIVWNGRPVTGERRGAYRSLFTAVFSDQYLFDRLYGIDADSEAVTSLLRRFGLEQDVGYDGARFSDLDLSSGQRMRLAMVVALLEDRPICVFDEWTAHQDPEMTRIYYDDLLPELLAAGKTVIAISHDDRFFDRADHLVRLDSGRLTVERRGPVGRGE